MGNIIYWKKYDEPTTTVTTMVMVDGKVCDSTVQYLGGYVCDDERVKHCYLTCGLNPEDGNLGELCFHLIFNYSSIEKFKPNKKFYEPYGNGALDNLISQAEQHLKELI